MSTEHPPATGERRVESDFPDEIEVIVSISPPSDPSATADVQPPPSLPRAVPGLAAIAEQGTAPQRTRRRPAANGVRPDTAATVPIAASIEPVPPIASELQARIENAAPIDAARMLVELGIYEEWAGDRTAARPTYRESSSRIRGFEPALRRLRRFLVGKNELTEALAAIDDELPLASNDVERADLIAERARVCEALGRVADATAAYAEALKLAPRHAASLWSLDRLLRSERQRQPENAELTRALANHLERMADACAPRGSGDGDEQLAAWLLVERADLLEGLGEAELARTAHDRAVALVPEPGPVRDARTGYLVRLRAARPLIASLAAEAERETDAERATRLLGHAARVAADELADATEARRLLALARRSAPRGSPSLRAILEELTALFEADGQLEQTVETRLALLDLVVDPRARAHDHAHLAETLEGLGRIEDAVFHAERSLELMPESIPVRERLDRMLERIGAAGRRARVWTAHAEDARQPTSARIAAYVRAADIALRQLASPDEALAHLRAAWALEPGNAHVLEPLSSLLGVDPRPADQHAAIRDRADLYLQAARAAKEPQRKVGLLELAAVVFEEELGESARAAELFEQVLEIDPQRRSAMIALARNAERTGDASRLAKALVAEAAVAGDPVLQRTLLLRAADVLANRARDPERALALIDRALARDPKNIDALSMRWRLLAGLGRHELARKDLASLIGRDPTSPAAFGLWIEIALLHEHHLKRPADAVNAYLAAAKLDPGHPLPEREIVRLLSAMKDPVKLAEALVSLAATDPSDAGRLLLRAAHVHEVVLGDDATALDMLARAEAHAGADPSPVFEAMERIFTRQGASNDSIALYDRWLASEPPASTRVRISVALGRLLAAEGDAARAAKVLAPLAQGASAAVAALRTLEHLQRRTGTREAALFALLNAQLERAKSSIPRCGLLWETAWLREPNEPARALKALDRLATEAPRDTAALDALVRVGGRLLAAEPSAHALREGLISCLEARRALTAEPITQAFYELERALLFEAHPDEASHVRALGAFRGALELWPESLLAARGCDRLATRFGDRDALLFAHETLGRLVERPAERAAHLVAAAEILLGETSNEEAAATGASADAAARATALFERALRADADCTIAATWLAELLAHDLERLVDRLSDAFDRATVPDAVVFLGTALARHLLDAPGDRRDFTPGITAMRRVLAERPNDAQAYLLLARLLSRQRLWSEARDALDAIVKSDASSELRVEAHLEMATLYEGPLADPPRAQTSLEAAVSLAPTHATALDRLHRVALARGDVPTAVATFRRRIALEADPSARVEGALRLADICRTAGDLESATTALCEGIVAAPRDPRAYTALSDLHRSDTTEGAEAYARALERVLELAADRGVPPEERWLTALGLLEILVLARPAPGVRHLQAAASLTSASPLARFALGRGLEATGQESEAIPILRDALAIDGGGVPADDVLVALEALQSALEKQARHEEKRLVEDVRACFGVVAPERLRQIRARRHAAGAPRPESLVDTDLLPLLLPDARSPMLEVARAIGPVLGKIVPREIALSSRDRVSSRDNPTRALAERIAAALGVERFELYVSASWTSRPCVVPGDPPAIIAPTWFAQLPEPEQAFALAHFMARIALGATWLDEVSAEVLDAILLAAIAAVAPSTAELLPEPRARALNDAIPRVHRALGRKQKKQLEEIAPRVDVSYDAHAFTTAVRRSAYRVAVVLAPSLLCGVDYLSRFDEKLAQDSARRRIVLEHAVVSPLLRYAITADAYAIRRRVGTTPTDG